MKCGYCDQTQKNLLATCMACHQQFCNNSDKPTSLSHILKHLKQTQHNSFSVPNHGDLKCHKCGKTNILDLSMTINGSTECSQHQTQPGNKIVQGKKLTNLFTVSNSLQNNHLVLQNQDLIQQRQQNIENPCPTTQLTQLNDKQDLSCIEEEKVQFSSSLNNTYKQNHQQQDSLASTDQHSTNINKQKPVYEQNQTFKNKTYNIICQNIQNNNQQIVIHQKEHNSQQSDNNQFLPTPTPTTSHPYNNPQQPTFPTEKQQKIDNFCDQILSKIEEFETLETSEMDHRMNKLEFGIEIERQNVKFQAFEMIAEFEKTGFSAFSYVRNRVDCFVQQFGCEQQEKKTKNSQKVDLRVCLDDAQNDLIQAQQDGNVENGVDLQLKKKVISCQSSSNQMVEQLNFPQFTRSKFTPNYKQVSLIAKYSAQYEKILTIVDSPESHVLDVLDAHKGEIGLSIDYLLRNPNPLPQVRWFASRQKRQLVKFAPQLEMIQRLGLGVSDKTVLQGLETFKGNADDVVSWLIQKVK